MTEEDLDRAARLITGNTLYQMYAEPWWHKIFRYFVPRDEWPEAMKGVTYEEWPECLPDEREKERIRAGLERSRKMMEGIDDSNSRGDQR